MALAPPYLQKRLVKKLALCLEPYPHDLWFLDCASQAKSLGLL